MSQQVNVFCPGARRCNVRVTPNTVLLQVLEQACSRQKLNPSLYTLKHHGKLLDLSLPLRFSGVPNNGKLELVEGERPRAEDGEVVVAVQTVDGTRVQSSFRSTMSLWDVLVHHKLDSSPDGLEPCLSYMRQEVSGEESLKATQLRSVGLSSGGGVMRLSHRSRAPPGDRGAAESLSVAAVDTGKLEPKQETPVLEPSPQRDVVELPQRDTAEPSPQRDTAEPSPQRDTVQPSPQRDSELIEEEDDKEEEPRKKCLPPSEVAMDTTEREEELPYFPTHPINYFSGPSEGEMEPMEKPGEMEREEGLSSLSTDPVTAAATLMTAAVGQSDQFPPDVVAAQLEEIASSPFAHHHFARPHPLTPPTAQPKVYDEPCDRERLVFNLSDPLPLSHTEEVSDTFFEHTVTDIQLMHSDLKRQASASDAPLMTRAMRAVRDDMRLEKYRQSIVRVYFPDRWVLQGCFRPRESLKMLVNFIRENLADPKVKFHLYTTPPKTVLRSAKVTFAGMFPPLQAGLLPAAVVYIGVENDRPHPKLSLSVLEQAVSPLQAEVAISQLRAHTVGLTSDSPLASAGPSNKAQSNHPLMAGPSHTSSSAPPKSGAEPRGPQSGRRLPKWFKPGHQ